MKSESQIQGYIISEINKIPHCKAINIHGNEYMEVGTPDIFCSLDGIACLIEVKTDGGKATEIQERRLWEWCDAGAVAVLCMGERESKMIVDVLCETDFGKGPKHVIDILEKLCGAFESDESHDDTTDSSDHTN